VEKVIVLTGFMGVGKSVVARRLAKRLHWEAVDLDRMIEALAGKTIPTIFETEGEEGFRRRETGALREALGRTGVVVSTGGGLLGREENRKALEGRLVVNLDGDIEELLPRILRNPGSRPLALAGEVGLKRLFDERLPLYRAVPRQVDTRGKSPDEVAREIEDRFLEGDGGGRP
jgi:shikimate kinase